MRGAKQAEHSWAQHSGTGTGIFEQRSCRVISAPSPAALAAPAAFGAVAAFAGLARRARPGREKK